MCRGLKKGRHIMYRQLSERLSGGKFNTEMPWVRNSACKATILLVFLTFKHFCVRNLPLVKAPLYPMAMKVFQSQASKIRRKTLW